MPQNTPRSWASLLSSCHSRPLLGTNGTEAMTALLDRGCVDLVDYLKVGPFMGRESIARLAADYPLLLHLDDTLSGFAPPSDDKVARIVDLVELTGTPWTSEHIGFGVPGVTLDEALITQATANVLSREQALTNIVSNAMALAGRLPVPLLLENIPFFPNLAHVHVCEPDFVAQVLEETGCGLLLDLAHARSSADVLGLDVHEYLSALPLESTVELHISGPRPLADIDGRRQRLVRENAASIAHLVAFGEQNLVDAHEEMQEEDYALLGWVLERTEPKAISLEYFREPEPLRQQLVRLGEMVGR